MSCWIRFVILLPNHQLSDGGQVLRQGRLKDAVRPAGTRYLARVCGWHGILPNSVLVSNYRSETLLGEGGSAKVWTGKHNGQKVAIKVLKFYQSDDTIKKRERTKLRHPVLAGHPRCNDVDHPIVQQFCKEVVIWKNLSHPNILPFIGAALATEPNSEKYEIVSEFMENGNIINFMERNQDVNRLELVGFD